MSSKLRHSLKEPSDYDELRSFESETTSDVFLCLKIKSHGVVRIYEVQCASQSLNDSIVGVMLGNVPGLLRTFFFCLNGLQTKTGDSFDKLN